MKRLTIKTKTLRERVGRLPSKTAQAAFRLGNAAGAHIVDKTKKRRTKDKLEERQAERGELSE